MLVLDGQVWQYGKDVNDGKINRVELEKWLNGSDVRIDGWTVVRW